MRRQTIAFTGASVLAAGVLGLLIGFVVASATCRHLSPWAPIRCILRDDPTPDVRPVGYEALRGLCVAGGGR